jgi:hypothetical protein
MRLTSIPSPPRWAVRVALAAALAWQGLFATAIYLATDGRGPDAVYGRPAPEPLSPLVWTLLEAGTYPGAGLFERIYDSPVLLYPQVLEGIVGALAPGFVGWVPVFILVLINVQCWTLAILAPLWGLDRLGAAVRSRPLRLARRGGSVLG